MTFFWGLMFIVFIIIELMTVNLVTIWFAFGSLITFFVSLFFDFFIWQIVVFIIASLICLILTKPIVKKLKIIKFEPTNSDRFIGKSGEVVKAITPKEKGEVKVLGTVWTAISDEKLDVGTDVVVQKIEGVKLVVKKEEKD